MGSCAYLSSSKYCGKIVSLSFFSILLYKETQLNHLVFVVAVITKTKKYYSNNCSLLGPTNIIVIVYISFTKLSLVLSPIDVFACDRVKALTSIVPYSTCTHTHSHTHLSVNQHMFTLLSYTQHNTQPSLLCMCFVYMNEMAIF